MSEHTSEVDPNLILLDEFDDFAKHALQVVEASRREILILSKTFDPALYNTEAFYQQILDLARADRNRQVKILVKDIQPVVEQGHRILALARRLSSKVEIRKLLIKPQKDPIPMLSGIVSICSICMKIRFTMALFTMRRRRNAKAWLMSFRICGISTVS